MSAISSGSPALPKDMNSAACSSPSGPYEWNASFVDHKMALQALFAAIRRIRPSIFLPLSKEHQACSP
jgi:hypothetical protein